MSQHGRIVGRWPTEDLSEVGGDLVDVLGGNIPIEAEYKAGKEVQIQLAKAVAKENNRGSITAAQKAGRATAAPPKTTGPGPGSRPETVLANALTAASNTVFATANALASSPPIRRLNVQNTSQLFHQPQSSPIRQPQERVLPHLPAPEPVKKTRKRKAVEDVGGVDLGPRRLQSKK
jgi:hypothetical protein